MALLEYCCPAWIFRDSLKPILLRFYSGFADPLLTGPAQSGLPMKLDLPRRLVSRLPPLEAVFERWAQAQASERLAAALAKPVVAQTSGRSVPAAASERLAAALAEPVVEREDRWETYLDDCALDS